LLADLMAKKRPQISAEGLDISRYSTAKESHKHAHPAPAH
jgi:D-amino-acid dehydrogenase